MPLFSGASESELPPWIKEHYRALAERARREAERPYQPYGGQRLAPIPEAMQRAHALSERTGTYLPYLESSTQALRRTQAPFYEGYERYMNPYMQSVVNRIAEEGNRNLTENILPALEAKFVRLGQHGSSKHATLARRAAREIQGEISAKQAQALASGYQQAAQVFNADQARALEGARQMATLGGLSQAGLLSDIAMLGEQGRYRQQQEQAAKDIAYQDFLRQQNYPLEMLAHQAALLHGIPTPTQQTSYQQSPATPQLNVLGQLGNLAGNIYAARMAST